MERLYVGKNSLFSKGDFSKAYKMKQREMQEQEVLLEKEKELLNKQHRSKKYDVYEQHRR